MKVASLPLPAGQYSITVMVVEDGYFDRPQHVFYSINPGVYVSLSRVLDIAVSSQAPIAAGPGVVCDAEWALSGDTHEL